MKENYINQVSDSAKSLLLGHHCDKCYHRLKYFMGSRSSEWYCTKKLKQPKYQVCNMFLDKDEALE